MPDASPDLPRPAEYFPPDRGRYDVRPGLFLFGRDLNNGVADSQVFQFDDAFPHYRAVKERVRGANPAEYVQTSTLPRHIERRVAAHIINRLTDDHPTLFTCENEDHRAAVVCRLTGETLILDRELRFVKVIAAGREIAPRYQDSIDALACQTQEDLAILTADDNGERLTAIHLCYPNHWSARQKIGNTFALAHEPVAGIEPITSRSSEFVRIMIGATQGLVRFAWGITFDDRLDHHPDEGDQHAKFDSSAPRAYLRVERQVIWGLPDVKSALFTIRTYLKDVSTLRGTPQGRLLAEALATMPADSRRYKGLETAADFLAASLR